MSLRPETPLVSVIIPTMASASRRALLQRAVLSVRASSRQPIRIIAVVNGNRFDADVCAWLKAQTDVHFEYIETPSLPAALQRGRELVETEFFSALDDDDEYLPGSTDQKWAVLQAQPQCDLVVGNYYQHCAAVDTLRYSGLETVPANPLEVLMQFNWLHNGNALFRSNSVGTDYFENYHAYAEWTWMAFRLAMDGKKVAVLDLPVFRCYGETPGSLSKSEAYFQSYIPLFKRMLALSPPPAVVRMIHRKMSAAYHDAAVSAQSGGRRRDAWRNHLRSLRHADGLRYLSYTRYLLK